MMETICATGIRVSEVRYITVEAARRGHAGIFLKGKVRVILLPGKLCRKLLRYAAKCRIGSGAIFLSRGGRRLDRRRIWESRGLVRDVMRSMEGPPLGGVEGWGYEVLDADVPVAVPKISALPYGGHLKF